MLHLLQKALGAGWPGSNTPASKFAPNPKAWLIKLFMIMQCTPGHQTLLKVTQGNTHLPGCAKTVMGLAASPVGPVQLQPLCQHILFACSILPAKLDVPFAFCFFLQPRQPSGMRYQGRYAAAKYSNSQQQMHHDILKHY